MRENKGGSGLAGAAACWFSGLIRRPSRSRRLVSCSVVSLEDVASLRSCPDGRCSLRRCCCGVCFTSVPPMPSVLMMTGVAAIPCGRCSLRRCCWRLFYIEAVLDAVGVDDDGCCGHSLWPLQLASMLLLAFVLHRCHRWDISAFPDHNSY